MLRLRCEQSWVLQRPRRGGPGLVLSSRLTGLQLADAPAAQPQQPCGACTLCCISPSQHWFLQAHKAHLFPTLERTTLEPGYVAPSFWLQHWLPCGSTALPCTAYMSE